MVSGLLLSVLAIAYLALLFAVAYFGERKSIYPGRRLLRPWIYSLALGVYCTSWTFFGAVGTAVRGGWSYLQIYLGPVLLFLLAIPPIHRLVAVVRFHNITSIADLVSSRFGKSPGIAALVTVMSLTAAVPYLALQYKAVGTSIDVLTASEGLEPIWYADTALWVALMMAVFAILFGTRRLDATEHHEGVMLAIAFESVVKLLAFVAVGVFAWLQIDAAGIDQTRLAGLEAGSLGNYAMLTVLSAFAIFCLPRQFHLGIVECASPADLRKARVVFTGYLAIISLLVVPIVVAGVGTGLGDSRNPDSFVLTLPLAQGAESLALLVFLGGLSAATGMVIVASIALATMITNDLVMPALWRMRWLGISQSQDLGRLVLWLRRAAILILAILAYGYHRGTTAPAGLAAIGLLAFALVAQFAPAIFAALYWRGATRAGIFYGLLAGFAVWAYTLLLPNFAQGPIARILMEQGPWGIAWLRPQAMFGIEVLNPFSTGALLALSSNVAVLLVLSWLWGASLKERMAATGFMREALPGPPAGDAGGARIGDLLAVTERILGPETARGTLEGYCRQLGRAVPKASEPADRGLLQHMERALAGAIGASSARLMFTHALRGRGFAPEDVAELLDETSQELRFSRQLLEVTMENVAQGISVADNEGRIVGWNRRYLQMFGYPDGLVYVGCPVADLIRHNAERGEFGATNVELEIGKRLAHMKAGDAYVSQRRRRNGRVYEMRGQPLPDGGYVTTYTDITEFKRTEQELLQAKQNLEQRVEERTWELQSALQSQRLAKLAAEDANLSKTRFIAAASHDLLQPLNAARLFATTLQERETEPDLKELSGRIDTSLRVAEEVLDDILDMARLESGTMRAEISDFPMSEVFRELQVQFAPLAQRRGLQLRVTQPPCWVRSDRVLLRRVLQNLISNALRYTQRGGVLVGCRPRGQFVELQVWDSGPGIPEPNQRQIFGEFRRPGGPSPWGEQGLGLGLSICDRIARLLGVELGLRSEPGRGSVFSIRVPRIETRAADAPSPGRTSGPAALPSSLVGVKVLCVDNEPEILEGMRALLGRWGMHVITAQNSAGALERLSLERPTVVLADYRLGKGDIDGLALLEAIEAAAGERGPAALVTADHGSAVAERARALGYPLLRKPVKPAALRALLAALVAQRTVAATGTNGR